LIDYFLVDDSIAVAYDCFPAIKRMIDAIPYNSKQVGALRGLLNSAFDDGLYNAIVNDTGFHKLTYKMELQETTGEGQMTFFGYLKERLR